ncbi:hypothetical protein NM208_g5166 [Fusarium decemcellulare]|uniref:Uncharacterized protein n=1 Tax=Fusarium decemcellulare TaxID=57161 RepID=A0ACC1SHV5_9HYPO|nr:hypothetical protein NM208_g5166 [Fusarium decemcellulare]
MFGRLPGRYPPHVKDIQMEFPARPFASYVAAGDSFSLIGRVSNARWYLQSQDRLTHEWDCVRPETTIYDTSLVPRELAFVASYLLRWSVWFDLFKQQANHRDCAEVLLRLEPSEISPAFAFDGVIVPAVCLTLHSREDDATQRRGISLLRTIRRREGVWDSQEMTDVFESMVTARRRDLIAWDAIPYDIPNTAKRLSGSNMPDLRFPQKLLLLRAGMVD